jgi:hypothetical protein
MEFLNAYLLSPGSIIVAVVTGIFFIHQSWQRFSRPKRTSQNSDRFSKKHESASLTVSKEPEVPDGWWSGRDVFELERRAIFSKVRESPKISISMPTYYDCSHGCILPMWPNSAKPDHTSLSTLPASQSS